MIYERLAIDGAVMTVYAPSFINLLGDKYEEMKDSLSLENRVSLLTVPAFLWHTETDPSVPCMNSLLFADRLYRYGIKHETVLFKTGGHGLSLADRNVLSPKYTQVNEEVAVWPVLVDNWITAL